MKAATVHEIKEALQALPPNKLVDITLRLAKFKKENKELLSYLLFESEETDRYVGELKLEMEAEFASMNVSHVYFAKKTLRKILRNVNKQARYIGNKESETALLLHYLRLLKDSGLPVQKTPVLMNLYLTQLKKTKKLIESLHEDLQYEYLRLWKKLAA
jgi:copper chaperone CopZ